MKNIFITITGQNHYLGMKPFITIALGGHNMV